MKTVFTGKLEPFLNALADEMDLYVPQKSGAHYVFVKYDPAAGTEVDFNNVRACTPVKEFLFPLRELAAVFPEPAEPEQIRPFAVFGLKACDLRSIEILDKVFKEDEFEDPFYTARREKMFTVSADCSDPEESCFCSLLEGEPFVQGGFDLNVSRVKDGLLVEPGSQKGKAFIEKHPKLFADAPDVLLAEREKNRNETSQQLAARTAAFELDAPIKQVLEDSQDSNVFDTESENCIECQACTRVCPTCHCFYLYDVSQKDYFGKMKMWDSCMRMAYAEVAGGENPRKVLGDRIRHRLMHKFSYFLDRYGIEMCVGCGRCVDADAGGMDIRMVFKKLNEELKGKKETKTAK
ncbi:MAG: 4Fe-4S dicluster domain-containing protein [Phycisphaerales bacterium]|nr:MAG: 4Fe-4S dicluster domain-containing protein [Phycisphaerales bacterium]